MTYENRTENAKQYMRYRDKLCIFICQEREKKYISKLKTLSDKYIYILLFKYFYFPSTYYI